MSNYTDITLGGVTYKNVDVEFCHYEGGRVAIRLNCDKGPLATATVNFPDDPCPADEVYIKEWSENKGMTQWLIDNKLIVRGALHSVRSGFVKAYRYELTREAMEKVPA